MPRKAAQNDTTPHASDAGSFHAACSDDRARGSRGLTDCCRLRLLRTATHAARLWQDRRVRTCSAILQRSLRLMKRRVTVLFAALAALLAFGTSGCRTADAQRSRARL